MAQKRSKKHPSTRVADPLEALFAEVPDRYAFCLLRHLDREGQLRFTRLQELLSVNSATLTTRLRHLARRQLIERLARRAVPPRVDYRLTTRGRSLVRRLDALAHWAERFCAR